MSHWNHVQNGFCENPENDFPEFFNSFTSLFISFLGCWALYHTNILNKTMNSINWELVFMGIGSFLFHLKGFYMYGLLDILPLFFFSWSIVYLAWEAVSIIYLHKNRQTTKRWLAALMACVRLGLILTLAFQFSEGEPWGISLGFVGLTIIPHILSFVGILLIGIRRYREYVREAIYVGVAFCSILFAASVWWSTKTSCDKQQHTKYAFFRMSHGLWHIFVTYGLFLITQMLSVLLISQQNYRFISHENRLIHAFYVVFPVVQAQVDSLEEMTGSKIVIEV